MVVEASIVNDEQPLYNALRSVLSDESALLTVPDTSVYNNFTIQNVLRITSYNVCYTKLLRLLAQCAGWAIVLVLVKIGLPLRGAAFAFGQGLLAAATSYNFV